MAQVANAVPVNLEKTASEAGQLRRNSTGKLDDKNNIKVNVLPNYLRASLSSCHDYCKYGFKREFKTIAWTPMVKRSRTPPNKSLEPAKRETLQNKSLKPVNGEILQKQKSSLNTARPPSDKEISTLQARIHESHSSSTKRIVTTNNPDDLKQKSLGRKESSIATAQQLRRRNRETNTLKGASKSGLNKGIDTSKGIGTSKRSKKSYFLPTTSSQSRKIDAKKVPKPKEVSHLKGNKNIVSSLSATRSQHLKPDAQRLSREISHLKSKASLRKAKIEQPNDETIPKKILYIAELNTKKYECPSPERRDGLNEKQAPKNEDISYTHRTIDSIEMKASPSSISLSSDSKTSSSSTLMSLLSPSSAAEFVKKKTKAGKDNKEDGDCSPRKLKFRKAERKIGIQSGIMSPTRLKFRQGDLIGESKNKNAEAKRKKSFRRTEVERGSNATRNEVNEVVLKPQNPEEKRSSQSSYNNVIEETARKLAKTRKSKVKALVGAFETIISLQDSGTVKL